MGSQTPRAAVTTDCPARVGASLPLPGQDLGQVALDWLPKHLKAALPVSLGPLPNTPPTPNPHLGAGLSSPVRTPRTPFRRVCRERQGPCKDKHTGVAWPPHGHCAPLPLGDRRSPTCGSGTSQCPEASGRLARGPPPLHKGSTVGRRGAVPHRTGFPAAERGREEPVSASLLWPGNRLVFPVKPAWWPPVHPCRAPKWPQYPPPCVPRYCGHGASARHSR